MGPPPTNAEWLHAVQLGRGLWPCGQRLRRGGDLCDGAAGYGYRCDRGAGAPLLGCGCDACCGCGCGCGVCFGFGCDAWLGCGCGCDAWLGCAHQGCGCAAPAVCSGCAEGPRAPCRERPEIAKHRGRIINQPTAACTTNGDRTDTGTLSLGSAFTRSFAVQAAPCPAVAPHPPTPRLFTRLTCPSPHCAMSSRLGSPRLIQASFHLGSPDSPEPPADDGTAGSLITFSGARRPPRAILG